MTRSRPLRRSNNRATNSAYLLRTERLCRVLCAERSETPLYVGQVAQHFWDVLKARFDDTDKAICTAYNLLASSELLAWDINVDLLRGIMAGALRRGARMHH